MFLLTGLVFLCGQGSLNFKRNTEVCIYWSPVNRKFRWGEKKKTLHWSKVTYYVTCGHWNVFSFSSSHRKCALGCGLRDSFKGIPKSSIRGVFPMARSKKEDIPLAIFGQCNVFFFLFAYIFYLRWLVNTDFGIPLNVGVERYKNAGDKSVQAWNSIWQYLTAPDWNKT